MKLTQEQKRIKIAEACGWVKTISPLQAKGDNIPRHWKKPQGTIVPTLPDYFNDLNACHEMEKSLDWQQIEVFNIYLSRITGDDFYEQPRKHWAPHNHHANATQRAEAFGLTLNLWTAEE